MMPEREARMQVLLMQHICFTAKSAPPTIMSAGTMYARRPATAPRTGTGSALLDIATKPSMFL
jgi:hypothetical protein